MHGLPHSLLSVFSVSVGLSICFSRHPQLLGPKICHFLGILYFFHHIWMKVWGNVLDVERDTTNRFGFPGFLYLALACPTFGPKLDHIWSQNMLVFKIFDLVYQISINLCGNVLDMKRLKTEEVGNQFTQSCPGMPIIWAQILPHLGPNYAVF